jgi:hypothetical protein
MALLVGGVAVTLSAPVALTLGIPLGATTYVLLLRVFRAVPARDRARLEAVTRLLPGPLRWAANKILCFVA